jgi:hypothetical protein
LKLIDRDFNLDSAFIIFSEDRGNHQDYSENLKYIKEELIRLTGKEAILIAALRDDPIAAVSKFHDILSKSLDGASNRNILIDVSTFTRDRLSCFINYFWRTKKFTPILHFCHTSPSAFNTEEQDGWLTKGVRKISSVPGFNGRQKIHKKSLLVLLLGHESERALTTVIEREPDSVLLIRQGLMQVTAGTKTAADRHAQILLSNLHTHLVAEKMVSHNDPARTHEIIQEIINEHSEKYNISVLSGGSKLQMLGLIWACLEFPEIELIYSYPRDYNTKNFSKGCGGKAYGTVDFDS